MSLPHHTVRERDDGSMPAVNVARSIATRKQWRMSECGHLAVVHQDSAMSSHQYKFNKSVPTTAVESSLILALWSCESLHGETRVQMDAFYEFRSDGREPFIDSGTDGGYDLNTLFVGLIQRELGPAAFAVVRQSDELCGSPAGVVP